MKSVIRFMDHLPTRHGSREQSRVHSCLVKVARGKSVLHGHPVRTNSQADALSLQVLWNHPSFAANENWVARST